jgi:hypothetical protein
MRDLDPAIGGAVAVMSALQRSHIQLTSCAEELRASGAEMPVECSIALSDGPVITSGVDGIVAETGRIELRLTMRYESAPSIVHLIRVAWAPHSLRVTAAVLARLDSNTSRFEAQLSSEECTTLDEFGEALDRATERVTENLVSAQS